MKYLISIFFCLSLFVSAANAEEAAFIESCESVNPLKDATSFPVSHEYGCKVNYSDGESSIIKYRTCEITLGCPQSAFACTGSLLHGAIFAETANEVNSARKESSVTDIEAPNLSEVLKDDIKHFQAEAECQEGSLNGKIFCEVVFNGEELIETDDSIHGGFTELLEGVRCKQIPGCKGFVNHCQESIHMLQDTCSTEETKKTWLCQDVEKVQSVDFLDFLLTEVYVTPETITPSAECVDSDGDGWGWIEATKTSCKVEGHAPTTSECVDTDGDGWGWNGIETCIPIGNPYVPTYN